MMRMGLVNENPWALVEMSNPFLLRAKDIFVPPHPKARSSSSQARLGIGDNYSMEIKVIPIKPTTSWPPIPLLSKNEGSLTQDVSKRAPGYEEGMLVANYSNLPDSPPSNVPLPAAFNRHNRTFQTKYGFELSAGWQHPTSPLEDHLKARRSSKRVDGFNDLPWVSDNKISDDIKEQENDQSSKRNLRRANGAVNYSYTGATEISDSDFSRRKRKRRKVKISFRFDMIKSNLPGRKNDFLDTVNIEGFCCPLCRPREFRSLQTLRFHLTNDHDKYRFEIENQKNNPSDGSPTVIDFKVNYAEITRERAANHVKDERDFTWHAPAEPFDVDEYLDGDTTWVGLPPRRRKSAAKSDSMFKPTFEVPPLTHNIRQPPKVPKSKTRLETPLYRSISHQIAQTGEELSESDDEIGKEWLSMKHADMLDPSKSDSSRAFLTRFDAHLLSENLANTKYLSDSVVRFVRANKEWLRNSKMLEEFNALMAELIDQNLTAPHVLAGCISIIHGKHVDETADGRKILKKSIIRFCPEDQSVTWNSLQGESKIEIGSSTGSTVSPTIRACNACHKLTRGTKANIVCSNSACNAPLYHLSCVDLKEKPSGNWLCPSCSKIIPEDSNKRSSAWLDSIMN
ncbi:MAG: hypothetical protein Q9227_004075 [Pyrenula ochraceoflavens]